MAGGGAVDKRRCAHVRPKHNRGITRIRGVDLMVVNPPRQTSSSMHPPDAPLFEKTFRTVSDVLGAQGCVMQLS